MKVIAGCTLLLLLLAASRAQAQNAPSSWNGAPPQSPQGPPVPGAAGYSPPPPSPAGYPPPAAGYAFPAYGGGYPYGMSQQSLYLYEVDKKNPLISLVLEWFVPGVGSLYADHVPGAITTWALTIGGIAAIVWGIDNAQVQQQSGRSQIDLTPVVLGVLAILGGRVYGLIDAYSSTGDYNRALARRLGLPTGVALGVAPIPMGQSTACGPALSLRF